MYGGNFNMQLEQFYYIVTVAKHGTFSKAAEKLHISQSAISQSVKKLENYLDIEIFKRTNQGVTLTDEGDLLVKHAQNIVNHVDKFEAIADSFHKNRKSTVKIGVVTGMHLPFLGKMLSSLKKTFPFMNIMFIEEVSTKIIDQVLDNQLDIGIVAYFKKTALYDQLLSFRKFSRINLSILVNKDSPWSSYNYLTLEHIKNETFVMFNGEYMNWFFDEFTNLYGPVKLLFKSKNNENITEAIKNNIAITIETESEVRSNPFIRNGTIKAIPLIEDINENSYLSLVKLKNKTETNNLQQTIQYLENEITKLYNKKHVKIENTK